MDAWLSQHPTREVDEPATKDFVELKVAELRAEIGELRGEMRTSFDDVDRRIAETRSDLAGVKGDLAEVRSDLAGVKGDLAEVRSDLAGVKGDLAGVRSDLAGVRAELIERIAATAEGIHKELRLLLVSIAGGVVAIAGLLLEAKFR